MQLAIATARRLGKYVSISATMLSDAVLALTPLTFEKPACEHSFACSPVGALCVMLLSHSVQAEDDTEKLKQSLQKRLSEIAHH